MCNIRLSRAKRKDVPAIADMAHTLVEHGLPLSWDERRVAHCLTNTDCIVINAKDGRRLVGFAIMEFLDGRAHLYLLAVQPGYQGQGIGRVLLEWLHSSARTAGIFLIDVEVRVSNLSAQSFYRSLGFCEAGVRRGYYGGKEDALRMSCNLSADMA